VYKINFAYAGDPVYNIVSQFIISGRIAYGPAEKRIYADRAAGSYSDHYASYGDIDAGIAAGQETGTSDNLS